MRALPISRDLSVDPTRMVPSIAAARVFDAIWLAVGVGLAAIWMPLPAAVVGAADIMLIAVGVIVLGLVLYLVLSRAGSFYGALVLSPGIFIFQVVALWCVMKGCRLDLSIPAGLAVLLIVHRGTPLPNAPGNIGTYQFFCVVGVSLFGIDKSGAAAFSLVAFIFLTIPLWALGSLTLSRSGIDIERARREAGGWLRRHPPVISPPDPPGRA